jgi:transcriptional regulator with XRE-family HTH domain
VLGCARLGVGWDRGEYHGRSDCIREAELHPSQRLKNIRARLGITTREVSEMSEQIATRERNPEYHISNAWLTQIENSDSVPSIFKLYSLSAVYRVKFTELLELFGVKLENLQEHQLLSPLADTHLTNLQVEDADQTVSFPVRFDRGFDIDNTNLLSRMVEVWGEIPIALIRHLDIRRSQYGFIGLKDFTLYPLIRPGSFVQVDQSVRKIQPRLWRTEYDRPIYFVELRDGYACSWCDLQEKRLLLIPHPLSPCRVRSLEYGVDAEIVGQVTAVAMRITDGAELESGANGGLPDRV